MAQKPKIGDLVKAVVEQDLATQEEAEAMTLAELKQLIEDNAEEVEEESEESEEEEEETEEEVEEEAAEAPKAKKGKAAAVIFVNQEKLARARDIVGLVAGVRTPKNSEEAERKEHFSQLFASKQINAKDTEKAVLFAYELLGGLVRSPEEQAKADERAKEQAKKFKKKQIDK